MALGGISRRAFLGGATAALAAPRLTHARTAVDFAEVSRRAALLARQPATREQPPLPEWARAWRYEDYREIEFDPTRALWHSAGLRFEVDFLPRGLGFTIPITINVVEPDGIRVLPFDPALYRRWPSEERAPRNLLSTLGFAGLRVRYPLIAGPPSHQECVVFLGASYFRAVGRGQIYGVSARALAIDTATDRPEEFPAFREFWLVRPAFGTEELTLFALLDGPSVTGAYEFRIQPGDDTVIRVTAELFARRTVRKVGLCPLSSMHLFGELGRDKGIDDFRPEVHDSDGLLLKTSRAEWLWRPLDNPSRLRLSRFQDTHQPGGFGLLQRDRTFDHYQDLEALYHRRPSVWVEPEAPWPAGELELVEFPSRTEFLDNVALHWVCGRSLAAGASLRWSYEMRFGGPGADPSPQARVVSTRTGLGRGVRTRLFVIDFEGSVLTRLQPDAIVANVTPLLSTPPTVEATPAGGIRVAFEASEPTAPTELRCFIQAGHDALSETWSYQWLPR